MASAEGRQDTGGPQSCKALVGDNRESSSKDDVSFGSKRSPYCLERTSVVSDARLRISGTVQKL